MSAFLFPEFDPANVWEHLGKHVRSQEQLARGVGMPVADAKSLETIAERFYLATDRRWHGRVAWVDSPLVGALTASLSALVCRGNHDAAVASLWGEAVNADLREMNPERCWPATRLDGLDEAAAISAESVVGVVRAAVKTWAARGDEGGATVTDAAQALSSSFPPGASFGRLVLQMLQTMFPSNRMEEANALYVVLARAVRQATGRYMAHLTCQGDMPWVLARMMVRLPDAVYPGEHLRHCFHQRTVGATPGIHALYCQVMQDVAVWVFALWPHEEFLIACHHPRFIRLEMLKDASGYVEGLLHYSDGPALAWPDGWATYASYGECIRPDTMRHETSL